MRSNNDEMLGKNEHMEIEVFYGKNKIEQRYEVIQNCSECIIVLNGKESYIKYEQYFDNRQFHISVLKVHELCRRKGIGCALICAAIQRCREPISKIIVKACAEKEIVNKYQDEIDYKKPRTQKELEDYYKKFSVIQNGKEVEFEVCKTL